MRLAGWCALAALCAMPSPASAANRTDGGPTANQVECARIDARIKKRKRFLEIRAEERLHHPTTPIFSPYCQDHADDEDCQLPIENQSQQDLSRDVSEYSVGPNGEAPVADPVMVPLVRRRHELHCPGPDAY